MSNNRIPKIIHQIWIGDKPRPDALMATCRDMNPGWEYRLWTEENLPTDFVNQHHIEAIRANQPNHPEAGQADIIRYELLYRFGGFYVDADTEFIRPLDDFLTDNDSFCCYESEDSRPGLLANGYLAATPNNRLMALLIAELSRKQTVTDQLPWEATGPLFLTQIVKRYNYSDLTVYPSHYFIPRHFTSKDSYEGQETVYCHQHWFSTLSDQRDIIQNAEVLNRKGESCFKAGQMEAAADWFLKAIDTCPDYAEPHNNLAVIYWQQNQPQKALDSLAWALRIDPAHADALNNLQAIGQALADENHLAMEG